MPPDGRSPALCHRSMPCDARQRGTAAGRRRSTPMSRLRDRPIPGRTRTIPASGQPGMGRLRLRLLRPYSIVRPRAEQETVIRGANRSTAALKYGPVPAEALRADNRSDEAALGQGTTDEPAEEATAASASPAHQRVGDGQFMGNALGERYASAVPPQKSCSHGTLTGRSNCCLIEKVAAGSSLSATAEAQC